MSGFTRLDSYQGAETQWHNLLPSCTVDTLFITHEWQRVWWERFGDGVEMILLMLEDDGGLDGIAPLARRDGTISFVGDQDLFDYNDFLVARGAEPRFYPCLLDHLEGESWEMLKLMSLPEDSPTLAYLPDLAREHGYSVEVSQEGVAPGVRLPDTWDAYVESLSKKDRHELRRKMRRLYSSGEEVRYYKLSDPDETEAALGDLFWLMRDSREDKHAFLTNSREQFFRDMASEMSRIGVFKLFFLEMGGERVAAAICFDYGGVRFLYNSGFNTKYGYYSVGLLLHALALKDAIEEGKVYFDFLRGDEPYKYHLGGADRTVYQMIVRRS